MNKKFSIITRQEEEKVPEEMKLGAIKMLVSIKKSNKKRLIFVDVKIAGTSVRTLAHTGATYLFISKEVVEKVGLKVEKQSSWIKKVNSQDFSTGRVVKEVEIQVKRGTVVLKVGYAFGLFLGSDCQGECPKDDLCDALCELRFLDDVVRFKNALATFCTLVNTVLLYFLDRFVVVHFDNIVIYNRSLPNT